MQSLVSDCADFRGQLYEQEEPWLDELSPLDPCDDSDYEWRPKS